MKSLFAAATGTLALACAAPAMAQNVEALPEGAEDTVFDDTWVSVGVGAIYSPSYDGSDDYVVSAILIIRAWSARSLSPRPGGVALDSSTTTARSPYLGRGRCQLNRNRASQVEDEVVLSYGELDTAFEVGPSIGISFLRPYDSVSFNIDTLWDVAGAHDGMTVNPGVTYFTPVSRGAAISLSVSGTYVDDDYADYYYSVPAGGALPAFRPMADGQRWRQFAGRGRSRRQPRQWRALADRARRLFAPAGRQQEHALHRDPRRCGPVDGRNRYRLYLLNRVEPRGLAGIPRKPRG